MERKLRAIAAREDRRNAEFWAAMQRALGGALDEVAKQADALQPPPDPEEEKQTRDFPRESEKERAMRNHPLAKDSMRYMRSVEQWMRKYPDEVPEDTPLGDALAVIRWYQHFIYVKFCRALSWFPEFDDDAEEDEDWSGDEDEFPSDADGSAKIAIIAIERSISAWSCLRELCPAERENIVAIMVQLARLRGLAERTFPKAREFHRPGFDDPGE